VLWRVGSGIVRDLTAIDTICKGNFPEGFNIQAVTSGTLNSVRFWYGTSLVRTESSSPFFAGGDQSGVPGPYNAPVGVTQTFRAQAFDSTGKPVGNELRINLLVSPSSC
jgi:hypothetical protein